MCRQYVAASLLVIGVALVGCQNKSTEKSSDESTAAATSALAPSTQNTPAPANTAGSAKAEARVVFTKRCQVCHGPSGRGDGPGAAALTPKPRDYSDPEWQSKTSDDRIRTAIIGGGAAIGLSPAMPPSPDLQNKPEVVSELVALIRSFKR